MSNMIENEYLKSTTNVEKMDLFDEHYHKNLKIQVQRKHLSSFILFMIITNVLLLGFSISMVFVYDFGFSTVIISILYNCIFVLLGIIMLAFYWKKIRKVEKLKKIKKFIGNNFLIIESFILIKLNIEIILAYSIMSKCLGVYCDAIKTLFLYYLLLNISIFNYFKSKLNIKLNENRKFFILLILLLSISVAVSFIFSNQIHLDYESYKSEKPTEFSVTNNGKFTELAKIFLYFILFINNSLDLHNKSVTDNLKLKVKSLSNLVNFFKNNFEKNNKNGFVMISSKNVNWNKQFEKTYETENFFKYINESLYIKTKINPNNNKSNNFSNNNNLLQLNREPTSISNINYLKNFPQLEAEKTGFFSTSSSLNNLFLSDKRFVNNIINNNANNNNGDIHHSKIYPYKIRSSHLSMESKSKFDYRRVPYSSSNLSMIKEPIKINLPKRVSSNPMIANDFNPLDEIEEISEGEFTQIINKNSKNMIRYNLSNKLKLLSDQKIDMKKLTPRNSVYLNPLLNSSTFKLGSCKNVIKKSFSNKRNTDKINQEFQHLKRNNLDIKENVERENILNISSKENKSKLFSSTNRISFNNFDDPKLTFELNQLSHSDILSKEIFAKVDSSSQSDSNSMISEISKDNENASRLNITKSDYNIKINNDQNLYLEYCDLIKSNREKTYCNKLNLIKKFKNSSSSVNNFKNTNLFSTKRNESEKNFNYVIKIDKDLDKDFRSTKNTIINSKKRFSNPNIKISVISEKMFEDNLHESTISKFRLKDEIYDLNNFKKPKSILSFKVYQEKKIDEIENQENNKDELKQNAEEEIEEIILKSGRGSKLNKFIKEGEKTNDLASSKINRINKFLMTNDEPVNLIKLKATDGEKLGLFDDKEKTINSSLLSNTSQILLINKKIDFPNKIKEKNFLIEKFDNRFNQFNENNSYKISKEMENRTTREKTQFKKLLGFELSSKNEEKKLNSPNRSYNPHDRQKSYSLVLPSVKKKYELGKKYLFTKNLNSDDNFNVSENRNLILKLNKKYSNKMLEFFTNNVFISIFSGYFKNVKDNDNNANAKNNLNMIKDDTIINNLNSCPNKLVSNETINAELVQLFNSTSENGSINFNYFLNSLIKIVDKNDDFSEEYDIGPFIIKPDEYELQKSNNTSKIKSNRNNINNISVKKVDEFQQQELLSLRKIISISLIRIHFNLERKFTEKKKNNKNNKYCIIIKEIDSFFFNGTNTFSNNYFSNSNYWYNPLKEKLFFSSESNNFIQRSQVYNPSTINLNFNQNISINNNNNDYNKINTLTKEETGSNIRNKRNYNQNFQNSCSNYINLNSNSNNLTNFNNIQNNSLNHNPSTQNNLYPNYSNSYKFLNNQIRSSLSSKNISYHKADSGIAQSIHSPTRSIKNSQNNHNNNLKKSASYSNISNNINIIENQTQNKGIAIDFLIEKLSAIMHDFKHVIYDNLIFFEFLVNKYLLKNNQSNNNGPSKLHSEKNKETNLDINVIKDEINYFTVMKDYTLSLILNLTNFMSNNDFLVGEFSEDIDLIKIINIMIKIFNKRLDYENSSIKSENETDINQNFFRSSTENELLNSKNPSIKLKNIKIKCIIIDAENPSYTKVYSNQNLLISLFYNILSNSYKYTENGEITVELSIVKLNNKNNILVKISDSGKGIPDEILDNWGKPFNFSDKSQGTGLGQFIISTLEKNLGLYIPRPEKNPKFSTGTIFRIYIPFYNDLIEKGTNVNMTIIGSSSVNPFNVQLNQSSFYLKSTRIHNQNLFIEENLKNFIEYDENALSKNNFVIRTIYIVCLDDELMFLNALNKSLKGFMNILEFYKFEVIFTSTFNDFLNEFMNLLNKNIVVDFFIFDQNISENIKGLDCSRIVNNFYKIYFKDKYKELRYYFFFITEDSEIMKICAEDKKIKKFLNKDQIFGKMQFNEMCSKIKNIIQEIDKDIIKPSTKSFILN